MNKRRRYKAKARRAAKKRCWYCRNGVMRSLDRRTHWFDGAGEVACAEAVIFRRVGKTNVTNKVMGL